MTLDFTNYTFSGLISLLAAILGIGYPLFLESIRKIDEQYDSARLSAKFQRENAFLCYRISLLASIATCFCDPFIMLLFPIATVCLVAIVVQALCVLWLVMEMLAMFQMVQEYYNPITLFYRIHIPTECREANDKRKEELLCLVDLARYASKRDHSDVYQRCKSKLLRLIEMEESTTEAGEEYNVSQDIFEALRQIAEYSKDPSLHYFYNDNIVSQLFFNYLFDCVIGPKTYGLLWMSACVVAEGGSDEWFRQHWSNADLYYTYRYALHPRQDEDGRAMFREHHYMLGAMALFYERYDWLRTVLYYTHSSPAKYPLVPSSYTEIFDATKRLEEQRGHVWLLTQKYQMKGVFADVNSDDKLLECAYHYAALLMIRIFSVNDYNISYSNPMQLPRLDGKAGFYEMKKELESIEMLRWHVNTWYGGDELHKVDLPVIPDKKDVDALLDQYKNAIENRMQYQQDHPVLDKTKMDALKPLLADADNKLHPSHPVNAEGEFSDNPIMISIAELLDNQMSAEGGYSGWSNLPDVLVSSLNNKTETYYDGLLVFVTCDIFTINERNVFKALALINPSKEDVIMSLGIYLPQIDMIYNEQSALKYDANTACYYNETEIISRTSNQSAIIVIRRNQLPSIGYLPPSDDMDKQSLIELPNSQQHLCTNIDKVITDGKPQPIIKLAKNIRGHIPEDAKGIRLVVKKNVDDTVEMLRLEKTITKNEIEK